MSVENDISAGNGATQTEPTSPQSRLQHYLNARVMVYYNSQSSYNDSGRVTYIDPHWLELTKENGERLLMPTAAVRILKLLEPIRQTDDAGTLLRPLEGLPPSEQKVISK